MKKKKNNVKYSKILNRMAKKLANKSNLKYPACAAIAIILMANTQIQANKAVENNEIMYGSLHIGDQEYLRIDNFVKSIAFMPTKNIQTAEKSVSDNEQLIQNNISLLSYEDVVVREYKDLSLDEKIDMALEKAKMSIDQLIEVVCITFGEGGVKYNECYDVASTFVNRTYSYEFVRQTNRCLGENAGFNIYAQAITPKQYEAYKGNQYNKFIKLPLEELMTYPGFEGVIDCILVGPSNNYLSFKSPSYSNLDGKVQLNPGGNYYHSQMTTKDTIPQEYHEYIFYGEKGQSLKLN